MKTFKMTILMYFFSQNRNKWVCALWGPFGPLKSPKLKIAFHQFLLISLLEE